MTANMQKSEKITALITALIAFQKDLSPIKMDSTNTEFNSPYASLSAILDATREALTKNGLSVSQWPIGSDGLCTILAHAQTGEFIESIMFFGKAENETEYGAKYNQARRYALAGVLGLSFDGTPKSKDPETAGTVNNSADGADDLREWITKPQFDEAAARIAKGEKGVDKEMIQKYQMKDEVRSKLEELQKAADKKSKTPPPGEPKK